MIFDVCIVLATIALGVSDVMSIEETNKIKSISQYNSKEISHFKEMLKLHKQFVSKDFTSFSNRHKELIKQVEQIVKQVEKIENFLTEHGKKC